MAEITYYPEVTCQASSSNLHETEVVSIADETSNQFFLRVGKDFLTRMDGRTYLPVTIVELDYEGDRALIQLPYEADSGANRLWVPFASLRQV